MASKEAATPLLDGRNAASRPDEPQKDRHLVSLLNYRVHRAKFYEDNKFLWNVRRVPHKLEWSDDEGDHEDEHPARTCGIYNVLSDLFHRAAEYESKGDAEQQDGVKRFRRELRRFIAVGSPLDKVAFLFGKKR